MVYVRSWVNSMGCEVRVDERGRYHYFCASCGASVNDCIDFKETGYYVRKVTVKCRCGKVYSYMD